MSLYTYQYTMSLSLYCMQMSKLPAISFSSSTVVRPCHSSTPQTIPSHDETPLTHCSMPEEHRPGFVGGAGTASCPVSRHFYHTYILQCNPAGREDTDAQQSLALMQLQHLWQASPLLHVFQPCLLNTSLSQLVRCSLTLDPYFCRKACTEINSD